MTNDEAAAVRVALRAETLRVEKARKRREVAGHRLARMGISLLSMLIIAVVGMGGAFMVMLGLGAAHDQWPSVPALGFWSTYLIFMAIGSLSGALKLGNRVSWKDKGDE